MAFLLLGGIFGKGVSETQKRQEGRIIPLIAPILLKRIFLKGVTKARTEVTRVGGGFMRAGILYNNNMQYES